jgi:hypothetical protein
MAAAEGISNADTLVLRFVKYVFDMEHLMISTGIRAAKRGAPGEKKKASIDKEAIEAIMNAFKDFRRDVDEITTRGPVDAEAAQLVLGFMDQYDRQSEPFAMNFSGLINFLSDTRHLKNIYLFLTKPVNFNSLSENAVRQIQEYRANFLQEHPDEQVRPFVSNLPKAAVSPDAGGRRRRSRRGRRSRRRRSFRRR